ncbi:CAP domain-containing protein [Corynebacterium sp. P7003]|uniref:CAP domain-containing protein n=1 Tax=Corynebacterium pygosceleis TaxID=2800406 RepID=A0A9Q4GIM1_9CORY|nr:CAP domain-containing protein [Corynebacterium pygosceleis]MCX7445149.1 CAP domain-containing protein [Corynebacterium pygosceleis]MCX7468426.1 CAP domain-containing protein [Corynebacterium pygosceleis]
MNTRILRIFTSTATVLAIGISAGTAASAAPLSSGSSDFTIPAISPVLPGPAPSPSPAPNDPESALNARVSAETIRLLNEHRVAHGLRPVIVDANLTRRSVEWSKHMRDVNRLYHSGDNVWENVLYNYNSASDASAPFRQWRNSPGHNANMLLPDVTRVGVGFATAADGRVYGTMQLFL